MDTTSTCEYVQGSPFAIQEELPSSHSVQNVGQCPECTHHGAYIGESNHQEGPSNAIPVKISEFI